MTDYMQLTGLYQAHKLQLESVFNIVLKSADTASCLNPTVSCQHTVSTASIMSDCAAWNGDLFLLICTYHLSPDTMKTKSP